MRKSIPIKISILAAIFSGNGLALTPILEEFESGKIDPVRWYHRSEAKCKFSQTNGMLNFRVLADSPSKNFASIELMTSAPGYRENWEMTLDISNSSNAAKTAGIGFIIFNSADRNDRLFLEYHGVFGINSGVFVNGKYNRAAVFSNATGLSASGIRVAYNKKTRLLTLSRSKTLSGEGYEWQKIGTFSPSGSGGDVRADWDMGAEGSFGIQLYGTAGATTIAAGKLTIDHFVISSPL
jgi:hypothetical protein